MKRFIAVALVLVLVLSLTGCWGKKKPNSSASSHSGSYSGSGVVSNVTSDIMSGGSMAGSSVDSMVDSMGGSSGVDSSMVDSSMGSSGTSDIMSGTNSMGDTSVAKAAAAAAAFPEGEWSIRLVNDTHPLSEDFNPETRSIRGYDSRQFDARAAGALEQLLADAEAAGNKLYLVSAYRSIDRQKALFARKTNYYKSKGMEQAEAEQEASKLVARPGHSEHNLGLAADIVSADWYTTHNDLTTEFETTAAFDWLSLHAAEYGFILRYPSGAEAETGINYEPWHYRYVGVTATARINAAGITLETYCQQKGIA